jgi:CRP-like cAMP-binding protein
MHYFRAYIEEYTSVPLSDADFMLVEAAFTPRTLKKREFLLRMGEVAKYFAFVVKGAFRLYTVEGKGAEHIVHLAIENEWIGDRESYAYLTPSRYHIDSLEEAQVLLVTQAQLLALSQAVPAIAVLVQKLNQHHFAEAQQRLHAAIACGAKERYAAFAARHPAYLQRYPQHMIASYLGISAETLSRIRTHQFRCPSYYPSLLLDISQPQYG